MNQYNVIVTSILKNKITGKSYKKGTGLQRITNNSKTIFNYIRSRFFEKQPNEICSHLSEKVSKDRFLKPEKLQNYSNEGKGKEKGRGEGKEEKRKKQWLQSYLL